MIHKIVLYTISMIKLVKSTFYQEDKTKKELTQFIKTAKQLSFGKECEQFETEFAHWQGRKHCVFLNSGSSANLAIIQALLNIGKLKRGDSVGFSSLTWSTNVMPIVELGLRAIPIDVELDTLNASSRTLRAALKTVSLRAFFVTNLLGFCDDIDEIAKICREKKILFIEDNCESLGTVYKRKKLGNFGTASTFSFYVGHHMSTIEGGAVVTDNENLATMLRLVRAHGWDRNLSFLRQNEIRDKFNVNSTFYSRYTFYDLGYNFRPTEISGFIGRHQLKHISEILKKRQQNFLDIAPKIYAQTDRIFPIRYDHIDFLSNFAIPIVCKSVAIRDTFVRLCDGKIEIRPIVGGDMTAQPFYKKHLPDLAKKFQTSNARRIHEQGLYFGNNPELTENEKKLIIQVFTKERV